MEDDNGLELTLGLSCGASSGKTNIKDVSLELKADEGSSNRSMSVVDPPFKNFFDTTSNNPDPKGKQKTASDSQQQETFWKDLGKCSAPMTDHSNAMENNLSQLSRYQERWASGIRTSETDEEKANKRKMSFEDLNFQNKHEKTVHSVGPHGNSASGTNVMRNSRVTVTTDDACSGVNEDVADSEAEGSNSFLVSQREEKSKSSDIPKVNDKFVISESRGMSLCPQKETSVSGGFSSYGVQPMPVRNIDHPAGQTMNSGSLQFCIGYSPAQLPTLETGSSWAFNTLPRHVTSDGLKTSNGAAPVQAPVGSSAGIMLEKSSDSVRGTENHTEAVSTSQNVDQNKAFSFFMQKDSPNQSEPEGNSREGLSIRPGVASDLKFGGSGSCPDLPWVTTTGPGPNGRTISGVTYKYNQNEVRIVCACHGTHMSPETFIQHASSDIATPENNAVQSPFPTNNPAASAKS